MKYRSLRNNNHWIKEWKKNNQKLTYFIKFEVFTLRKQVNEKIKQSFKHLNQPYYIDCFDIGTATITEPSFPRDIKGQIVLRFETLEDQYEGKKQDLLKQWLI
jgi:hypothetical protein